ncbi:nucleotidyltransferase domain-containing protein [Roseibium sp. RP-7]
MTDLADLRSRHLEATEYVVVALKDRGVKIRVVGSLARGTDFSPSSDIDLLVFVLECPDELA